MYGVYTRERSCLPTRAFDLMTIYAVCSKRVYRTFSNGGVDRLCPIVQEFHEETTTLRTVLLSEVCFYCVNVQSVAAVLAVTVAIAISAAQLLPLFLLHCC